MTLLASTTHKTCPHKILTTPTPAFTHHFLRQGWSDLRHVPLAFQQASTDGILAVQGQPVAPLQFLQELAALLPKVHGCLGGVRSDAGAAKKTTREKRQATGEDEAPRGTGAPVVGRRGEAAPRVTCEGLYKKRRMQGMVKHTCISHREVGRGGHHAPRSMAAVWNCASFFKSSKRLEGHVSLLCFLLPSPALTCCLTQVFRRHGLDLETDNLAWHGHKDAGSRFAVRQSLPCKRT